MEKRFLSATQNALRTKPLDDEALKEQEIKRLKQKVGELVMDLDILKEATKANLSWRQMSDEKVPSFRQPPSDTSSASSTCHVLRCVRRYLLERHLFKGVGLGKATP